MTEHYKNRTKSRLKQITETRVAETNSNSSDVWDMAAAP